MDPGQDAWERFLLLDRLGASCLTPFARARVVAALDAEHGIRGEVRAATGAAPGVPAARGRRLSLDGRALGRGQNLLNKPRIALQAARLHRQHPLAARRTA